MAYVEVHQAVRDHRKVLDLAVRLDMPEPHVVGHLVYLWLWSIDNSSDGLLPSSVRLIERACGWVGQTGRFVQALVESGLLDQGEDGALWIHDWWDYMGRLVERRRSDAERKRLARTSNAAPVSRPPDIHRTSTGHPQDVQRTVPYPTGENPSVPESAVAPEGKCEGEYAGECEPECAPECERERESKQAQAPEPSVLIPPIPSIPLTTSAPDREKTTARPGNPHWDALVESLGTDASALTRTQRSNYGRAVKELKEARASPDEIRVRIARMLRHNQRHFVTVNFVVAHWAEYAQDISREREREEVSSNGRVSGNRRDRAGSEQPGSRPKKFTPDYYADARRRMAEEQAEIERQFASIASIASLGTATAGG